MDSRETLADVCTTVAGWLRDDQPTDPHWPTSTWRTMRIASRVHGVAPTLARRLSDASWVEPESRDWLAAALDHNQRRLARLHDDAVAILANARRRGIALLPLKGLPVTALYLDDPGIRPMADIDFVVRPNELEAAAHLLEELGYRRGTRHFKHLVFFRPDNATVVSREFEHPENPRPVEVHTVCGEVFARTPVDLTDAVWASSRERVLLGERALVPSLDLLWTHLLIHTSWQFLYGGGRLVQLLDLVWLAPHLDSQSEAVERIDPRAAMLAVELVERCFRGVIEPQVRTRLRANVEVSFQRLADSLDLVNSSHFGSGTPFRARRILRFHRARPAELAQALLYILTPRIEEMHINHNRVSQSNWRVLAYPLLWAWHVANLTVRS